MTTFTTFDDLPVEVKQNIRRIQDIASAQRTTAEAAVLTANDDAINNEVIQRNDADEIVIAQGKTLPTGYSGFAKGAIFIKYNAADGTRGTYINNGTNTDAAWSLAGAGLVLVGEYTTAGGGAAEAATITGAVAGDMVIATLKTAGATPRTIVTSEITDDDEVTFTFSGDPADDHVVTYAIYRAAA